MVAALAVGAGALDGRASSPEAAEAAAKSSPAPPKLQGLDYFTAIYNARRLQAYVRRARTVKFKIETPQGKISKVKAKFCGEGADWCEVNSMLPPGKVATRLIRDALNDGATSDSAGRGRGTGAASSRATVRLNASTCDFLGGRPDFEERWYCRVRLR